MPKTTTFNKPPTEEMIDMLMDIHERELMKMPPIEATGGSRTKGLMLRNLVTTFEYTKKPNVHVTSLRLTTRGYNFLKNYI